VVGAVEFSSPHIPPEQGVLVAAGMLVKHTQVTENPVKLILVLAAAALLTTTPMMRYLAGMAGLELYSFKYQ
jgi:hypothetical protein